MALNPAIVSRSEIETYLGIVTTVTDADRGLLEMLRQQTENLVRRFCGHNITQASYTEFYPIYDFGANSNAEFIELTDDKVHIGHRSNGGDTLYLKHMFVSTVTSVHEDLDAKFGQGAGDFPSSSELTAGTQFYIVYDEPSSMSRSGILRRLHGDWSSSPGTIKVVYTAGLTAAQLDTTYSDLKLAVLDEIAVRYRIAKSREGQGGSGVGLVGSEWIAGEYKVVYETDSIKSINENTLSPGTMDKLQAGGYVRLVNVAV